MYTKIYLFVKQFNNNRELLHQAIFKVFNSESTNIPFIMVKNNCPKTDREGML